MSQPTPSVPAPTRASAVLRRAPLLCLALSCWPAAGASAPAESGAHLRQLLDAARQRRLWDQRPWHLLLHYRRAWLGGVASEADGAGFFLSPKGKRDPQAELEATLAAFFADPVDGEEHPQCRFPARYAWLKQALAFDGDRLVERRCERFDTWRSRLNADSVTLIFADAYLDNPPSMYGHTFLRLNQAGHEGGERLLDYAINYSADTATDNGIVFAVKGLVGGYPGRFATTPFYIKVQEYTNLESRDLWEYHLSLTRPQIDRMLAHLWELGGTYFDYFFLTENCSYQLLPLLEIADPELRLVGGPRPWVIPIDTIRRILAQPGLVVDTTYRPSHRNKMIHTRSLLRGDEVAAAQAVSLRMDEAAEASLKPLEASRQRLVLDAALDYYRYREGFTFDQSPDNKRLERRILLRRRQLGIHPDLPPAPPATPPHVGHGTGRLGAGTGTGDGSTFAEVSLRPALQDLAGDHTGYLPNSHLEMFHLRLRVDEDRRRPAVEELAFLQIISITPWDPWIRKRSWRAGIGLDRARELDCRGSCLYFGGYAGSGWSAEARWGAHLVGYAMAQIDGGIGPAFRDRYRAGAGGRAGVLVDLARRWRMHLMGSALDYPLGDGRARLEGRLDQVLILSRDVDCRLSLLREGGYRELFVTGNLYF